ncbi:hypothetical protein AAG906_003263 [Vitis piasezkii]
MVCTLNLLPSLVSLASQTPIGPVVLMIKALLVAFVFFFVLTLSYGVHVNRNFSCLVIWCDNIGATCIDANLVAHVRTKHIEVDVHFVCDKISNILTKPLSISQFNTLKVKLNVKVSPFRLRGRFHVSFRVS